MVYDDQLSGPPVVTSTKIAKLPNPRNSIYEALRFASLNPERKKWLEAKKTCRMGRFTVGLHQSIK